MYILLLFIDHKDHNFNALYRNEKFSDIVLIVNDNQYKSHKSVLI